MVQALENNHTLFGPGAPIRTFPIFTNTAVCENGNKLREFILQADHLSLVLLQISDFSLLRYLYGDVLYWEVRDKTIEAVRQAAARLSKDHSAQIGICLCDSGEFGLLSSAALDSDTLLDWAFSVRMEVQTELRSWLVKHTGLQLKIQLGYGSAAYTRFAPEQELIKILSVARKICTNSLKTAQLSLTKEFRSILSQGRIQVVYQPVLDFSTGRVLGWEALSRGPAGSQFESPISLFDYAEESGSLFELEKVCRQKALAHCSPLNPGQKLFLNIHPQTLVDPNFTPGETRSILRKIGLEPDNVVFEITERHSIKDFSLFHKTLTHYRSQGFLVAVDDVGTGYSGLWTIAQIRPDFMKIDMSLVQGLDRDPVKRSLMETFVTFADKIGSKIIAEGIETETVFSALLSLGVHFGQGFYFSRPKQPKPQVSLTMHNRRRSSQPQSGERSFSIEYLVQKVPVVNQSTSVKEVKDIMARQGPMGSVIVAHDGEPVGLVMSYHLDRQLASQYGVALYSKRDVASLMDSNPLVVDAADPVENVASLATGRNRFKIYDDIIVTQGQNILGVSSVQKLIDAMAKFQIEMAKGANPLTGLPGNIALESEIETRLVSKQPFSIIYADLDNFKAFNDIYGFQSGDQVIKLLAKIIQHAVSRHGSSTDLAGHVGGDDFIIITGNQQAERICVSIVRCFRRLIKYSYSPQDKKRGWIEAQGRDGKNGKFPFVSVSLGILHCSGQTNLQAISERAAEVKTYAKSQPGNAYVTDRRGMLN
ncbi:MAG: bifunctional diguanylate cyclase/phosphodiesterase [Desulfovermiculus sp.]